MANRHVWSPALEITSTRLNEMETDIATALVTSGATGPAGPTGAAGPAGNAVTTVAVNGPITLGLTHVNKTLLVNRSTGSPVVITVPPTSSVAFPGDSTIEILQAGTDQVQVVPGSGVPTPVSAGGLKTRTQGSSISLLLAPYTAVTIPSTNLLARLRADDLALADTAAVASWTDTTGLVPAAAQGTVANQPALRTNWINGHKAVAFDGNNDNLSLTGAWLALGQNRPNLMVTACMKLPAGAITGVRSMFSLSTGTGTGSRVSLSSRNTSGFPSVAARRLDADAFLSASGTTSNADGEAMILTACALYATNSLLLFKNGTQIGSASFATGGANSSNTASLTGFIGANANNTAEWTPSALAELFVYAPADAATATSVRASMHTYLQNTYNIPVADSLGTGVADTWYLTGDSAV